MKTLYLLFWIMQSPTGADVVQTQAFVNLGTCEYVRQINKSQGFIVSDSCAKMNYRLENAE